MTETPGDRRGRRAGTSLRSALPWVLRSALSTPGALQRYVGTTRILRNWGVSEAAWGAARERSSYMGLGLQGLDWIRRTDGFKAAVLYALCRTRRPRVVVETGVASGTSSAGILAALADNGQGHLFSVDLPGATYTRQDGGLWTDPATGATPGWRVPQELTARWTLRIGSSRDLLPGVLQEARTIDMFYHDSEHTYENMTFELAQGWSALSELGLLVVDNVDWSQAYSEFLRAHPSRSDLLFPFLGVVEKGTAYRR